MKPSGCAHTQALTHTHVGTNAGLILLTMMTIQNMRYKDIDKTKKNGGSGYILEKSDEISLYDETFLCLNNIPSLHINCFIHAVVTDNTKNNLNIQTVADIHTHTTRQRNNYYTHI